MCVLIILVLISIMVPVMLRAKKQTSVVVCASNMRQIYLAMKLYEDTFDAYPPNNVTWPAFQMFYPVVLQCPASKHAAEPLLRKIDYELLGQAVSMNGSSPEIAGAALQECRAKRGSNVPLVTDSNHLEPVMSDQSTSFTLYLVRENGQFQRLTPASFLSSPKICDETLISRTYNY